MLRGSKANGCSKRRWCCLRPSWSGYVVFYQQRLPQANVKNQAAKESSGNLMDLVIPLVEESLVPPAKEYFEEDGIAL